MNNISQMGGGNYNQNSYKTDCSSEFEEYRVSNYSKNDVLNFLEDQEDNYLREISWTFGKAFEEIFQNPDFVQLAVNDAMNSPLKETNLSRIYNNNRSFKLELESLLNKNIPSNLNPNGDVLEYLTSQLIRKEEQYYPVIVIPNLEYLNTNLPPIISSGLELNHNLDSRIDNDVHAVVFDDTYCSKEIFLGEEDALFTEKPVLIFSMGLDDEAVPTDGQVFLDGGHNIRQNEDAANKTTTSTKRFAHLHISIKSTAYFYEKRRKKNEYELIALYLHNDGWGWIWNTRDLSKLVRKFEHNQCNGTQYTNWGELYYADTHFPPPTNDHYVMFNTYERDWAKSVKYLGEIMLNGHQAYMYGRMKETHNWYLSDPYTQGGKLLTGNLVNVWDYIDIQSYKSKFAITRIQ